MENGAANEDFVSRSPLYSKISVDPKIDKSKRAELYKSAAIALTSVPLSIQKIYEHLGGTIAISSNPEPYCNNATLNPNLPSFLPKESKKNTSDGCFVFERHSNGHRLHIVIRADHQAIRHNLVRIFGYQTAQFIAHLEYFKKNERFELNSRPSDSFEKAKAQLTREYLKDISQTDFKYGKTALEQKLGVGAISKIRANIKNEKKDLFAGVSFMHPGESKKLSSEKRTFRQSIFESYVFAESFDSWHCSRGTNARMLRDFEKTYAEYTRLFEGINKDLEKILAKVTKEGFSLADDDKVLGNVATIDLGVSPNNNGQLVLDPTVNNNTTTSLDIDTTQADQFIQNQQSQIQQLQQQNDFLQNQVQNQNPNNVLGTFPGVATPGTNIGPQMTGTQQNGVQPMGTVGPQPLGTQPMGTQPNTQMGGVQPMGTQPMGTQPMGTQPMGTQPMGTQPIGMTAQPLGAGDQGMQSAQPMGGQPMGQPMGGQPMGQPMGGQPMVAQGSQSMGGQPMGQPMGGQSMDMGPAQSSPQMAQVDVYTGGNCNTGGGPSDGFAGGQGSAGMETMASPSAAPMQTQGYALRETIQD
jgi:hypothetical protein